MTLLVPSNKFFFFWTLFLRKLYLKNFNIKNKNCQGPHLLPVEEAHVDEFWLERHEGDGLKGVEFLPRGVLERSQTKKLIIKNLLL